MKRLYLAAVAGLWSVAPLPAQEGTLAPTAPVVPAPTLQNGTLLSPAGGAGWGAGGSRVMPLTRWAPFRNPATATATDPVAPAASYAHPLPPLPAGVSDAPAACGPTGCGHAGRERLGWDRVKAWLCYRPSRTEMPTWRPTPYVTPLQGMFACTPAAGCATGCASGPVAHGQPQPVPPPQAQPMPPPAPPVKGAGAVMLPPRGTQGAAPQPTWQGKTVPAVQFAAKPAPNPNPVVNTSLTYPAPK